MQAAQALPPRRSPSRRCWLPKCTPAATQATSHSPAGLPTHESCLYDQCTHRQAACGAWPDARLSFLLATGCAGVSSRGMAPRHAVSLFTPRPGLSPASHTCPMADAVLTPQAPLDVWLSPTCGLLAASPLQPAQRDTPRLAMPCSLRRRGHNGHRPHAWLPCSSAVPEAKCGSQLCQRWLKPLFHCFCTLCRRSRVMLSLKEFPTGSIGSS